MKCKIGQNNTITLQRCISDGLSIGLQNPKGKGSRLIVKIGLLLFKSYSTAEMNGDVFEDYIGEILPSLENNSFWLLSFSKMYKNSKGIVEEQ